MASISIVAYSGIQEQARRTSLEQSIANWDKKALRYHKIASGGAALDDGTCLVGSLSSLPAENGFNEGTCSSDGNMTYSQTVIDSVTTVSGVRVSGGVFTPVEFEGVRYRSSIIFTIGNVYLVYWLKDDKCLRSSDTATVSGEVVQCMRVI